MNILFLYTPGASLGFKIGIDELGMCHLCWFNSLVLIGMGTLYDKGSNMYAYRLTPMIE